MAQHGGTAYLADALSPTATTAATLVGSGAPPSLPGPRSLAPSPSQSTSSRRRPATSAPEGVSLGAPRPDGERATNEYVETPFRSSEQHHHQLHPPGARRVPPVQVRDGTRRVPGTARRLMVPEAPRPVLSKQVPTSLPVTKQPTASQPPLLPSAASPAATFTKDGPRTVGRPSLSSDCVSVVSRDGLAVNVVSGSIICPACGRCRCESCRSPRPLPSAWLCHDSCFCSAETSVDYASCLCCVKGLFYHCGGKEGYEGGSGATSCADDPCSCSPPRRCLRWACLCSLSAALPCLLCYWPLRGLAGAIERCYGRYAGHGCRCQPRSVVGVDGPASQGRERGVGGAGGDLTPEKRLLASSPDF